MDWKIVTEHILELKNLADNEAIKDKLEGLSLYNCWLKQILDGKDAGPEIELSVTKEDELKKNTLAKIYELQKQIEQAQTPEEEASKLIECFLYIDNYLSLYSEPELFFIAPHNKLQLCDSVGLLNSKIKFDNIIQSMFFFQELNAKTHISITALCNFLRESKTNVSEFIDKIDYAVDKLDFLNRAVFDEANPNDSLKQLYPFVLIVNFTAQKLMIHRFTSNYPANVNKKVFQEALKQKEYVLDRIKGKILKRAAAIKQLKEKISEPMNQDFWFDARCIEVYDENIVAKREEPEQKGDTTSLIITADKINKCCEVAYWTAFLMANEKKLAEGERNLEADDWLNLYFATAKNNKYEIQYSLHKFLTEQKIETVASFNNMKVKALKKEKGPSLFSKIMPLWLILVIAAAVAAVFVYFILTGTKSIIH